MNLVDGGADNKAVGRAYNCPNCMGRNKLREWLGHAWRVSCLDCWLLRGVRVSLVRIGGRK
jgi:hypothetical protein